MPLDLPSYTLIHVVLSLVGIIAGLVVVGGLMAGICFNRWVGLFLAATVLTNVSGFGLPFVTLLPSPIVGALSLPVLPFLIQVRRPRLWRARGSSGAVVLHRFEWRGTVRETLAMVA